MRTSLDTNILVALWSKEGSTDRIRAALGDAYLNGAVVMSGPVFTELHAHPQTNEKFINNFIRTTGIIVDYDLHADGWKEVARSYSAYCKHRRSSGGGEPKRLLADFMVGAHAKVQADRLMTLDESRYAKYFPNLKLITP